MTARDEHLADVLCHCDQTDGLPQDGHPLDTPGCASVIKASNRAPDALCRRDHRYQFDKANCPCQGPARGTCPACGKRVRVVLLHAYRVGDDKVEFTARPIKGRHVLYGVNQPGMAPHRHAGKDCAGEGQVPTETTYREGNALREYRRAGAA